MLALGLEMRKKKIVRGLRLKNCGRVILIGALFMKGEGRPWVILGPPDMAVESKAGNWR